MFRKGIDTKDNFVEHIRAKFNKLEKKGKSLNELAITDPFAFKKNDSFEHPLCLLNSCINHVRKLNKVTFLVDKKHYRNKTKKDFQEILNQTFLENSVQNVDVIFDSDFHDRFWFINNKKAFFVGTSLNTIGNKHFFVQDTYFKSKDVKVLLDLCFNEENYDSYGIRRDRWCYEKQSESWTEV